MPRLAYLFSFVLIAAILAGCTVNHSVEYKFDSSYSVADPQFPRTVGSLLDPPLVAGNSITTLINGDQIFPAMLAAISSAQANINFETHVYWNGNIAHQFAQAFADRARAGVKVRVLVDAYGSAPIDPNDVKLMKDAGVLFQVYHPLNPFDFTSFTRLDHRTHRKLLITDGTLAFTGGVGIADMWTGNAQDQDHWRDNHYRVEGPIVAELQSVFADNWLQVTGEVLDGAAFFPPLKAAGSEFAQVFKSSPKSGSETMQLLMLFSIAHAGKSIRIESAYFVPDKRTRQTLIEAAKRGVKIQIVVPGRHTDEQIARSASRSSWGSLLNNGIEIYEYRHTMIHCKLLIVDDLWTSIGSANLDNRSFRINDEANINVYDHDFAVGQSQIFEIDKAASHRITLDEWNHRSVWEILTDPFANAFRPEL